MARISFTQGVRFCLRGEWFIVRDVLLEKKYSLESQTYGSKQVIDLSELEKAFFSNELFFEVKGPNIQFNDDNVYPVDYTIQDFSSLPVSVQEEAWRRYKIVRPILDWPKNLQSRSNLEKYAKELQEKVGNKDVNAGVDMPPKKGKVRGTAISRASIMRWLRDYVLSGQDIRSLVPQTYKSGAPGTKRMDPEIENIISQVIHECEINRKYRRHEDIYFMAVNKIGTENKTRPIDQRLSIPSKSSVYQRVKENGDKLLLRRQKSRIERQPSEPVRKGPKLSRILQRVEFDSTQLDLIVVDEEFRLPIGRPTLSYCIDCYSGYPLGFYLGFEPPSYSTTMSCALHAFSQKPDCISLYGTTNQWLARGIPEVVVIDNAKEYVNKHFLDAMMMLNVVVDQCPVRTPWMKGRIERFFRTNNTGLIHYLPGSTFSNIIERGDYNSESTACITLSSLIQMLHIFLLDIYSNNYHKGVKGIPAKIWMESEKSGFVPSFTSNYDEMKIILSRTETRTLQRYGIEYENITYRSSDIVRLRSLLKAKDRTVKIKVDPNDITRIYVLDPLTRDQWLEFFADDSEGYTDGLSLWTHRIIVRSLNEEKRKVDFFALAEAKAKIQAIVENDLFLKKNKKIRKAAHRIFTKLESSNHLSNKVSALPESSTYDDKDKHSEIIDVNPISNKPLFETPLKVGTKSIVNDDSENGWGSNFNHPKKLINKKP